MHMALKLRRLAFRIYNFYKNPLTKHRVIMREKLSPEQKFSVASITQPKSIQVGQCCEQAAQAPTPPTSVNSLLSNLASPRLPGQCQSLCAPNFKLSFSHFACVDHISTIVDCYRDLLIR
jgi:hypothetical protein